METKVKGKLELKVSKNITLLGEVFKNWPKDLLRTNVKKNVEFC